MLNLEAVNKNTIYNSGKNENEEEPKEGDNVEGAPSEDDPATKIAKLKAEIAQYNQDVQGSQVMEKYGKDYSFDYDKTQAGIEEKVRQNEEEIRKLEDGIKNAAGLEEINKLKAQIAELNQDVQKNQIMEKYGKDHGFNKNAVNEWIEKTVKDAEDKIRALENATKKTETREADGEKAKKDVAIDKAIEILEENGL